MNNYSPAHNGKSASQEKNGMTVRLLFSILMLLMGSSAIAQLRMAIEVTPNNPEPEERVIVRVIVTNTGSAAVENLQAQVDYPVGLSSEFFSQISDGGQCNSGNTCDGGEFVFWDIARLAAGSTKTFYLVPAVSSTASDGQILDFDARLFDGNGQIALSSSSALVKKERILDLAVAPSQDPVLAGEELSFRLTFGNRSASALNDVELRFPLPSVLGAVSTDQGGTIIGDEMVWDLGTLGPGEAGSIKLTAQVDGSLASGDLVEVDSAEISGAGEFSFERTRQQASVRVESAGQLALSIDTPADPLRNEAQSPIHVTVTNRGSTTRTGVRAELYFPPGLSSIFFSQFSDGGQCGGNTCSGGETAFWNVGDLPPGRGRTLTMVAPTRSDNPDGRLLQFFARAFAQGTSEFWEREALAIDDGRALNLEVDADQNPVSAGGQLVYELSFGNQSTTAVDNATLRFPLPEGTSLIEASDGGTPDDGDITWPLGLLNPGDSGKRRVAVQVDGSLVNGDLVEVDSAEISGAGEFSFERTRQQASVRVESAGQLALSIDTPADPLRNEAQSPIHVTVTNRGSTTRTGVRAELYFPPGLSSIFFSQFSDGGQCDGGVGAGNTCNGGETAFWNVGDLPPGRGRTLTMVAPTRSDNPDGRLLQFFARAFAQGTSEFWEREALAIDDGRPLTLEIDAETNPVPSDMTINYRITAGNQGRLAATGTTLTLPIPAGTSVLSANGNAELTFDAVTWNMGTLEAGQATRRSLTLSLDAALDPGDILELVSGALVADGMPVTRNSTTVRTKNNRELNQALSLTPETAIPGTTVFADTVATNTSPMQLVDVTAEIAALGVKEFFDIGLMNSGTSQSRSLELTLATGSDAFELGTLINFYSRIRSASTDADFQTRTLIVGEQIPPPPPPAPEIEVIGNGIVIANGDNTPSTADGTEFGAVDILGDPVAQDFIIKNTNTGDLQINAVSLSGGNSLDFTITNAPAQTISGGGQSTLRIEFSPRNIDTRSTQVIIQNNDSDEDPYTFTIAGEGIDPTGELLFKDGFE